MMHLNRNHPEGPGRFDASMSDAHVVQIGPRQLTVKDAIAQGYYKRDAQGGLVRTDKTFPKAE
jgi:hypothetical protein